MEWLERLKSKIREEYSIPSESEDTVTALPKECEHLWWDSPPYFIYSWKSYNSSCNGEKQEGKQTGNLIIKIQETYICLKCGKRNDENLLTNNIECVERDAALAEVSKIKGEYKSFCKPRAEVEDKIKDIQYKIDHGLLQTLALYQPQKVGSIIDDHIQIPILSKFLENNT